MTREDFMEEGDEPDFEFNRATVPVRKQTKSSAIKFEEIKGFVLDENFLKGLFYTSLPLTISTIVLTFAYKRDLMLSRSTRSPIFKIPLIIILCLAFVAPFASKYWEDIMKSITN